MKKIHQIIIALFIMLSAYAQSPEKINYQAVIRDSQGNLLMNKDLIITASILQDTASGNITYSEIHEVQSNSNGLVSFEIGAGQSDGYIFSTIDWKNGPYFIKTETVIDQAEVVTTISELLSVPYALQAKNATKVNGLLVQTEVPENAVFTDHKTAYDVTISPIDSLGSTNVQVALEKLQEVMANLGDMKQSVYDTSDDGTIDNTSKVNGFTVDTSVPEHADFTDDQKATEVLLTEVINIGGIDVSTVEQAIIRLYEEYTELQIEINSSN